MPEVMTISLACPNCGAKLEITPDIERFICLHCGSQQLVRRGGGLISIQPLVQGIERVQYGTDRTAAELAIRRLTDEINHAQKEINNWETLGVDGVLPPSIAETTLLIFGLALLPVGFVVTLKIGGTVYPFILVLGVVLVGIHTLLKIDRRIKARKKVRVETQKWSAEIKMRQQQLEKNRRVVNA